MCCKISVCGQITAGNDKLVDIITSLSDSHMKSLWLCQVIRHNILEEGSNPLVFYLLGWSDTTSWRKGQIALYSTCLGDQTQPPGGRVKFPCILPAWVIRHNLLEEGSNCLVFHLLGWSDTTSWRKGQIPLYSTCLGDQTQPPGGRVKSPCILPAWVIRHNLLEEGSNCLVFHLLGWSDTTSWRKGQIPLYSTCLGDQTQPPGGRIKLPCIPPAWVIRHNLLEEGSNSLVFYLLGWSDTTSWRKGQIPLYSTCLGDQTQPPGGRVKLPCIPPAWVIRHNLLEEGSNCLVFYLQLRLKM